MRPIRPTMLIVALLVAAVAAASPKQGANANKALLDAMSPYEDMIEYALAGGDAGVTAALAEADRHAAKVEAALSAPAARDFASRMDALHKAHRVKNNRLVASGAVEIFRLLADNLRPDTRAVPPEVSLLDYVGFKLEILAASGEPDWRDAQKTAGDARVWWKSIRPGVSAEGLRDAFDSVVRGLEEAASTRDVSLLRFAAQMDLDLVDLLESDLQPKAPRAPGPR